MKKLTALFILLPALALAQTTPTVDVNKAFKVVASHDGVGTTQYVLTVDRPGTLADVVLTQPVSALTGGDISFDVAAQATVGAYTAVVCARNVDPADATNFGQKCTAALAFAVAKPVMPPPPTTPAIRLIGTITIAGMRFPAVFEVASVEGIELPRSLRVGGIGQ